MCHSELLQLTYVKEKVKLILIGFGFRIEESVPDDFQRVNLRTTGSVDEVRCVQRFMGKKIYIELSVFRLFTVLLFIRPFLLSLMTPISTSPILKICLNSSSWSNFYNVYLFLDLSNLSFSTPIPFSPT